MKFHKAINSQQGKSPPGITKARSSGPGFFTIQSLRKMDFASRYGGEEIAIIMPNADMDLGYQAAERIRVTIEKLKFNCFGVTVSIGVSEKTDIINRPEKLIKAADDALYEAKRMGKNQTRKASGTAADGI